MFFLNISNTIIDEYIDQLKTRVIIDRQNKILNKNEDFIKLQKKFSEVF